MLQRLQGPASLYALFYFEHLADGDAFGGAHIVEAAECGGGDTVGAGDASYRVSAFYGVCFGGGCCLVAVLGLFHFLLVVVRSEVAGLLVGLL